MELAWESLYMFFCGPLPLILEGYTDLLLKMDSLAGMVR